MIVHAGPNYEDDDDDEGGVGAEDSGKIQAGSQKPWHLN